MLASERYSKIVELTNEKGFITTKDLAIRFDVSETTIRRDCEDLEEQGLIIRVHGGAKSINQKMILSKYDEAKMIERKNINSVQKDIVAKKAASLVKDGDCIFLDGGSSIMSMLKYLNQKKLKIVTNNTLITNETLDASNELFLIGGQHIPEYNMLVGPVASNSLSLFNFDLAFLSCAGIDIKRKVVYTAEMDTMAIKEKAMLLSNKNYLLADSSKFNIKGFCSFINSDDFDAIICNKDENILEEEIPNNFILVE